MSILLKNNKLITLLLVTIWCTCQFRPSITNLKNDMKVLSYEDTSTGMSKLGMASKSLQDMKQSRKASVEANKELWSNDFLRYYCHTPNFDHFKSFIRISKLRSFVVSNEISAERYFKIPHLFTERDNFFLVFIILLSLFIY